MVNYICHFCKIQFSRKRNKKDLKTKRFYCSLQCMGDSYRTRPKEVNCLECNSKVIRIYGNYLKKFCNSSCAAKYNNKHKTKGTRISKLENYIKKELQIIFPNLVILFNEKSSINSELDIYIPSINLAFEINGIFHYKPIFGEEKLAAIKINDKVKKKKCKQLNIKLIVINTSKQKYFTEKTSKSFLTKIINNITSRVVLGSNQ